MLQSLQNLSFQAQLFTAEGFKSCTSIVKPNTQILFVDPNECSCAVTGQIGIYQSSRTASAPTTLIYPVVNKLKPKGSE